VIANSVSGEGVNRVNLRTPTQGDLLRLVDSYTGQALATSREYAGQVAKAEAKIIELQQELERLHRKKN
jgi:hypothetical protein